MGSRKLNRLRVAEFNCENLFLLIDHYQGQDLSRMGEDQWQALTISSTGNKPIEHVRGIARVMNEIDADIWMLSEVGGRESLENLNRHFLNDAFQVHLIEGNSERGIDLGYLVRKELPFKYDLISHKHRSIDFVYPHERDLTPKPVHRFSRDVLELRVFKPEGQKPDFILLLVHLKSQVDRDGIDPGGRDRRRAELEKLLKIYKEIQDEFSGQMPILVGGDFNGSAARGALDPEFESLYRDTDLIDVLELINYPPDHRYTHMQIDSYGSKSVNRQIDYIFVSKHWHKQILPDGTFVYRFKDELGLESAPPRNINEKKQLPSDHYPVVSEFSISTD